VGVRVCVWEGRLEGLRKGGVFVCVYTSQKRPYSFLFLIHFHEFFFRGIHHAHRFLYRKVMQTPHIVHRSLHSLCSL